MRERYAYAAERERTDRDPELPGWSAHASMVARRASLENVDVGTSGLTLGGRGTP